MDFTHTHNFLHNTLWYSPYFLYFCEFQKKKICRALPDIGWTLCFCIICICSLCNVEVCKVPSAGQVEILQTLYGKLGWNSWQQRAPIDLSFKFKCYKIHIIFLAKSEDILHASSQLQKFFSRNFHSGTQKINLLRAIYFF